MRNTGFSGGVQAHYIPSKAAALASAPWRFSIMRSNDPERPSRLKICRAGNEAQGQVGEKTSTIRSLHAWDYQLP
jgi:hypothetical protein